MLPDSTEHACQVARLTPDGAVFLAGFAPPAGLDIVAYIDEIGRLEAVAGHPVEGGFAVAFKIGGARRERIASRIRSLQGAPEEDEGQHRRHPRHDGANSASHITMPDGRVYPCEVIDISVSGAAVRIAVVPAIGTSVMLGKMRGRVARYLDFGVGIEFDRELDSASASALWPR